MSSVTGLANGGSAIALGAYLVVVAINGNAGKLADMLKSEGGYLDFVVALFVLGAIQKYGPAGQISNVLTGIAIVAFLLRTVNNNGAFSAKVKAALSDFAAGKVGIIGGLREVAGV